MGRNSKNICFPFTFHSSFFTFHSFQVMDKLKELLSEVQDQSMAGNRKGLSTALRQLMNNRRTYYQQSMEENVQGEYADALYKILLLELDEEEEDSIEIAELTYLSLGCAIQQSGPATPEYYKCRLLLLHYFCDFFTDAIIEVFLSGYRTENILQARSLAVECLEKMQLADMIHLEEEEADFINKDEQLADACNAIETDPDLSDEGRRNAALLHKVLLAYLKAKYKH